LRKNRRIAEKKNGNNKQSDIFLYDMKKHNWERELRVERKERKM
jgi:hypothetical protein